MEQNFYICEICGNIVAKIRDSGVPVYCCGSKMKEIEAGVTEASGEKHIPVCSMDGNTVTVNVGSVEHPMESDHYIEWICVETESGVQYKVLKPGQKPNAKFILADDDKLKAVYAFCNQHSLWKH